VDSNIFINLEKKIKNLTWGNSSFVFFIKGI
jgi:hypothetical protein